MSIITSDSAEQTFTLEGFVGHYTEAGGTTVGLETYTQDSDPAALFVGLPDDACQCPHWGIVLRGRLDYRYTDGTVDQIMAGQAYYARPGHTPLFYADTEIAEFSPTDQLAATIEVVERNMEAMSQGGDVVTAWVAAWRAAFESADEAGILALYAPDAVLDANVPFWRYQLQGRSAIGETLRTEEFVPGRTVVVESSSTTGDGALVETVTRVASGGEETRWRTLHHLVADANGIRRHVFYCTGIWNAETIRRQAADAPMVGAR